VVEHQGGAADGSDRVADALPGDVRRGAVHRFEHRREPALRVEVGTGGEAEAAGQGAAQVGEDVRVQVRGDHHGQVLGLQDELRGHGVDQHTLGRHVRVVGRDTAEHLVPQDHAVLLRVALGHAGDLFVRTGPRELEREPHDPLTSVLGEQRRLHRHLTAVAPGTEVTAAEPGVLTLGVLPDDDPVEFGAVRLAQRALDAGQELHRPYVRPLVEVLADVQPQTPETDVVRDSGPADRAEVDGVEFLELVEAVLGHHPAVLGVVVAAPAELLPVKGETAVRGIGERVQHGPAGFDDLDADTVGGDGGDPERLLVCHINLRRSVRRYVE
jgi:hypothetical protein